MTKVELNCWCRIIDAMFDYLVDATTSAEVIQICSALDYLDELTDREFVA